MSPKFYDGSKSMTYGSSYFFLCPERHLCAILLIRRTVKIKCLLMWCKLHTEVIPIPR